MKQPRRRIVVHYDRLKPYHGQFESSIPASSETMAPTDQSDPATPSDYEDDEPVIVYPSPQCKHLTKSHCEGHPESEDLLIAMETLLHINSTCGHMSSL